MFPDPKKRVLYFFTGSFPYNNVETFIESEIQYISLGFDKVFIIPSEKSLFKREIPENAVVLDSLAFLFNKRFRKIRSVFSFSMLAALIKNRKYVFNISAIRRILSFVSDSQTIYFWLRNNKIEHESILYSYWFNGKTFGALKYKNKHDNTLKVISRAHGYDIYDYRFNPPFWPYRQKALDLIDRLYLISNDAYDFLRSKYNVGTNIKVFRLGIRVSNISGKFSADGSLTVLSVANLTKVKRIPLLLNFLEKYAFQNPEIKINWIHFGDGIEMPLLMALLSKVKSQNFFPVLKGRVSNQDIFEFYENEKVDIFINLSESEGIPVSIMEAQMYGKFVIATNVGGTKELVKEPFGLLVPKDVCYEDIRNAIDFFFKNKSKYFELTEGIRANCISSFNASKNYKEFANDIFRLLD